MKFMDSNLPDRAFLGALTLNSRKTGTAVLAIILVGLVLFIGVNLRYQRGAYFELANVDPAYAYLMNSLAVAVGVPPTHVDHPGTTVQELGALAIYGQWFLASLQDGHGGLIDSVLQQPERYLDAINDLLLIIVSASIAAGMLFVLRLSRSIFISLLVPAVVLASPQGYARLSDASAEPLLLALAILTTVLAHPSWSSSRSRIGLLQPVLFGIALGAGVVTKVNFLPLGLLLLNFRKPSRVFAALASTIIAIATFTIPIWPALPRLLGWLQTVATHTGTYGSGPEGFPSLSVFWGQMVLMSELEVLLPYALIAAAVACLFGRDKARAASTNRSNRFFFASGFATVLGQLMMVAKHPESHYLLPAIGVATVLIPLALSELSSRVRIPFVGSALAVIGCIFVLQHAPVWQTLRKIGDPVPSAFAALEKVAIDEGCRLIPYTRAGLEAALNFGDFWAGGAFTNQLRALHPNFYYYNQTVRRFRSFGYYENPTADQELLGEGKSVCIAGTDPLNDPPNYAAHYQLELTAMSGVTSLYRVVPEPAASAQ
jgi:hypothetical protein